MAPGSLVAVPYKAGDYLSAGLPVINCLPGELEYLLREHQCGAAYRYADDASLAAVIQGYLDEPDRLVRERENARRLFETYFNRAQTYPRWADWLEQLVSS